MSEIIADKNALKNGIFLDYFKYQNPSFLVTDLISAKQNKNEKSVCNINTGLIDLRKDINAEKKFLEIKIRKKQSILLKRTSTLINNKEVKTFRLSSRS